MFYMLSCRLQCICCCQLSSAMQGPGLKQWHKRAAHKHSHQYCGNYFARHGRPIEEFHGASCNIAALMLLRHLRGCQKSDDNSKVYNGMQLTSKELIVGILLEEIVSAGWRELWSSWQKITCTCAANRRCRRLNAVRTFPCVPITNQIAFIFVVQ